jgi:hypothetical protein
VSYVKLPSSQPAAEPMQKTVRQPFAELGIRALAQIAPSFAIESRVLGGQWLTE